MAGKRRTNQARRVRPAAGAESIRDVPAVEFAGDAGDDRRPLWWDRLGESEQELAGSLARAAGDQVAAQRRMDEVARALRAGGVSWAHIGWLCGMTAEGARLRWGRS
jgi:hypothetical protein